MSDITTVARPYAKAIFEYALAKKQLTEWSQHLLVLAQAVLTPEATQFINNPASNTEQHIELLQSVTKSDSKSLHNLIALLATNKRLMLLPEINSLYEAFKAEQEKTLTVDVRSFSALSKTQENKLIDSLSQRLQRNVSLNISIDSALLGGAVLQAGDLVIDGSILGKLHKMHAELAI